MATMRRPLISLQCFARRSFPGNKCHFGDFAILDFINGDRLHDARPLGQRDAHALMVDDGVSHDNALDDDAMQNRIAEAQRIALAHFLLALRRACVGKAEKLDVVRIRGKESIYIARIVGIELLLDDFLGRVRLDS